MDWTQLNADWNQLRAFLATAEEGSFSGAAKALSTTQPTIGRQVASLEESLGVTLVERSGRGLELTQAGRKLVAQVRVMGEAAANVSMIAEGQSQDIEGVVTISATDLMAFAFLPAILPRIREMAPRLHIRVVCSNDIADLMKREADIAIRHVRPEQPELIGQSIGEFGARLYGTRSYLQKFGWPMKTADIGQLDIIGVVDPERLIAPMKAMGIELTEDNFVIECAFGSVVLGMVLAGLGISMLPEGLEDLHPQLEKVSDELPALQFPVWLVTHRELRTSRRIRLVYDALAEGLKGHVR